jgi:hypothetical protein
MSHTPCPPPPPQSAPMDPASPTSSMVRLLAGRMGNERERCTWVVAPPSTCQLIRVLALGDGARPAPARLAPRQTCSHAVWAVCSLHTAWMGGRGLIRAPSGPARAASSASRRARCARGWDSATSPHPALNPLPTLPTQHCSHPLRPGRRLHHPACRGPPAPAARALLALWCGGGVMGLGREARR